MSRCVRFPPRGFVWNGASGEALIELLQARREKVAAEKRRKEKKRKRKEDKKRRKKEEKRKKRKKENEELEEGEIREKKCSCSRRHMHKKHKKSKRENEELEEGEIREKKCSSSSRHMHKKHKKSKKCDDYDKLVLEFERSNLTEEHEEPIGDHHSLCDSTDNTEKARPKFATQDKFGLPASNSTSPVDDKAESSLQHVELQFRDLFVNNATPFPTQTEHFHDQEWLFERRLPRRNPPIENTACNENDSCLESSSLYPCLRYLPHAGIYALPYTIWF